MSVSIEQAEKLAKARQPIFGWVELGNGKFTAPNDFSHEHDDLSLTPEFEAYAERMQVRWSITEYLRVIIQQWRERGSTQREKTRK